MSNKTNTKRLTVCAMLSALGVVLLWIGSILEVAEISMAVIASLLCVIAVIEYGGAAPWLVYAVTGLLGLVLLPNKGIAAMYLLFFGYYPIVKEKLEQRPRVLRWVLKELIFYAAVLALAVVWKWLLFPEAVLPSPLLLVALLVLAQVVFVLYDIALTRLISFYVFRLRQRFRWK